MYKDDIYVDTAFFEYLTIEFLRSGRDVVYQIRIQKQLRGSGSPCHLVLGVTHPSRLSDLFDKVLFSGRCPAAEVFIDL